MQLDPFKKRPVPQLNQCWRCQNVYTERYLDGFHYSHACPSCGAWNIKEKARNRHSGELNRGTYYEQLKTNQEKELFFPKENTRMKRGTQEYSRQMSENAKNQWADPETRRKRIEGIRRAHIRLRRSKGLKQAYSKRRRSYSMKRAWASKKGMTAAVYSPVNGLAGTRAFVKKFVVDQATKIEFREDGSVILQTN